MAGWYVDLIGVRLHRLGTVVAVARKEKIAAAITQDRGDEDQLQERLKKTPYNGDCIVVQRAVSMEVSSSTEPSSGAPAKVRRLIPLDRLQLARHRASEYPRPCARL